MTPIRFVLAATALLGLTACAVSTGPIEHSASDELATEIIEAVEVSETLEAEGGEVEMVIESDDVETEQEMAWSSADVLEAALNAQPMSSKVRYDARHPRETLTFFGVEPGMTVVEALPGGGWYSKILMRYLGPEGTLIGAQYPDDIWAKILPDPTDEDIAELVAASAGWPEWAESWGIENSPRIENIYLPSFGKDTGPTADVVLFIRVMHNLNRADEDRHYFTAAIAEAYALLKPGGIVGVVQHRAPAEAPDEWADGRTGYLKQDYVIAAFEAAGFELEAASEINANPRDKPGLGDVVWRLPPTYLGADVDTPEREAVEAIGESDRMTLKFRKPA